jgi:hypothetical protein
MGGKTIKKISFWAADNSRMIFCYAGRGQRMWDACEKLVKAGLAIDIQHGCIQFVCTREQVEALAK